MYRSIFLCVCILTFAKYSYSARILFAVGTPSYSHQIVFQPIWKELSLRGHQVTVITTNPLKDPTLTNLTELDMGFVFEIATKKLEVSEKLVTLKDHPFKFAKFFLETMGILTEEQLAHADVQKLIKDDKTEFDLVMVEFLLPTMLAFGHRFKSPIIALTSLDASFAGHDSMGNPSHPALNPDSPLPFNVPMTFIQRVFSTVYSILRRVTFKFVKDHEDLVIEKYFGPGYPPLGEIINGIDMFFMNVNPAFHNVRPTVPAVIHIGGGMHIKSPKPLPEDIQKFLDDGRKGVIYFSMGAVIKTNTLSPRFMNALIGAFAELPYKILWKLDEDIPDKPDNMLVKKWVPQQDVLRHKNVKLFITPGGLQSIEEAINFRMPTVVIPYCSDHFSNSLQVRNRGFGLVVDYNTVDKETLKKTILEVITNPQYKENANTVGDIASDQPMTGLEKAVWWTEYVLRHNGAKHLRSPAIDMPLYQYFLLDVIALLGVVIFITVYLLIKITKLIRCGSRKLLGSGSCKRSAGKPEKVKKN